MCTFDQALFDLYNKGYIAYEEALRNADSTNGLRLQIKLHSNRPPPDASAPSAAAPKPSGGLSMQLDEEEEEEGE